MLRGVRIEGGDLSPAEGGGGVHVNVGQLDGCAFSCEENVLCGWFTYDRRINKCYLKEKGGYFTNDTQTVSLISGSTKPSGCSLAQREERRRQPEREVRRRVTDRRQPETPGRRGRIDYYDYSDYDYSFNNLDYLYRNYDYLYSDTASRRGVLGGRGRGRSRAEVARPRQTHSNPFLGLLG